MPNVDEMSEPEESKGEDHSAILQFDSIFEETKLEFEQRMGLIKEYKTSSNSNFSILSKH